MSRIDAITELRDYVMNQHDGRVAEALDTIGGLKLVRKVIGLPDWDRAVLDPRLYDIKFDERQR